MNYVQYTFQVDPPTPGSEILIALIADLGFESFETTDTGFLAYLPASIDPDTALSELQFDDFKFTYAKKNIERINWNEEWEKNFDPVIVSEDCVIRAPFHKLDKKYPFEIVIMPKMSFGTGHHDTTRLVCKNMMEYTFHGKRVLDMGCGTGVLAILAKLLGAKEVLGIDIDDWSVENAIENCVDNNFSDINIAKGDASLLVKERPFDIILANINKNILKEDVPVYSQFLKPDGLLFLSGFFTTDCPELTDLGQRNNLKLRKQENSNEWAVLVFDKV